ncbi:hypothetical protein TNCV_3555681 [Trichonephila clavipes]|nr:hypothetical protein TNCV_3555681 [Trichonephila clavipes]
MDFEILKNGQVTRMTPELAPPSSDFNTAPTVGYLSLDILDVHRPPLHGGSSGVLGSNSRQASHESGTLTTRLLRPTRISWNRKSWTLDGRFEAFYFLNFLYGLQENFKK